MIHNIWLTRKPKFTEACILITGYKFRKKWTYDSCLIEKVDFEDKWYWGWLNMDGEEIDDLKELRAKKYYTILI